MAPYVLVSQCAYGSHLRGGVLKSAGCCMCEGLSSYVTAYSVGTPSPGVGAQTPESKIVRELQVLFVQS